MVQAPTTKTKKRQATAALMANGTPKTTRKRRRR
jgi:hypothetical protein